MHISFVFVDTRSCYMAQASQEIVTLLPQPPSAGRVGVSHHTRSCTLASTQCSYVVLFSVELKYGQSPKLSNCSSQAFPSGRIPYYSFALSLNLGPLNLCCLGLIFEWNRLSGGLPTYSEGM